MHFLDCSIDTYIAYFYWIIVYILSQQKISLQIKDFISWLQENFLLCNKLRPLKRKKRNCPINLQKNNDNDKKIVAKN